MEKKEYISSDIENEKIQRRIGRQLSLHVTQTYMAINQCYYRKQNLASGSSKKFKDVATRKKKLQDMEYQLSEGEEIFHNRYCVYGQFTLGSGSFSQVVEAQDIQTGRIVAIKIVRKGQSDTKQAQNEIRLLKLLKESRHLGKQYIVEYLDSFIHKGHYCIVLERLDITLARTLSYIQHRSMGFRLISKLASQILMALDCFVSNGIIHCDLKPHNILMVNRKRSLLKVADFGSSCLMHQRIHTYIQTRYYRAPEILLGMEYTTAIDMWSLGCILVELHTGKPLFHGSDSENQLLQIIAILGMPPQSIIANTHPIFQSQFFEIDTEVSTKENQVYRVKQPMKTSILSEFDRRSLREIIGVDTGGPSVFPRSHDRYHQRKHYELFLDFISRMLDYNPKTRITPKEALEHEFMKLLLRRDREERQYTTPEEVQEEHQNTNVQEAILTMPNGLDRVALSDSIPSAGNEPAKEGDHTVNTEPPQSRKRRRVQKTTHGG